MDWLDEVAEFARYLPAWTDPKTGLPKSLKHYVYGSARIRKMHVREQLRIHDAVTFASATNESRNRWRDDRARDAGY